MIIHALRRSSGNSDWQPMVAGLLLPILLCSTAGAALLTPNGNPTGANPAMAANGTSTLDLNANYRVAGNCPWLLPALSKEGYNAANNWTINVIALNGNISLGTYVPWVNADPPVTQGSLGTVPPWPAAETANSGGASLGLGYVPAATTSTTLGANNPATTVTHWIQVVHTNDPTRFGALNGVNGGNGYTNYIDDGANFNAANPNNPQTPNNPFYDPGYTANQKDFVDAPYRGLATRDDWQAQVFLAEWAPVNASDRTRGGTLDIYDGVWWGFHVAPAVGAPEPASLSLLSGCIVMLLRRRGHVMK